MALSPPTTRARVRPHRPPSSIVLLVALLGATGYAAFADGAARLLADREGVRRAFQRALALDPHDEELILAVSRAQGVLAPPEASATATGTPLSR